jgi:hypothetical protein
MERRQEDDYRCRIVRRFVADIADDTERMICFLYQRGDDDSAVQKKLKLTWGRLTVIKLKLAIELVQAGIRLRTRR